jgi:biotin operon repressor BirA-like protein
MTSDNDQRVRKALEAAPDWVSGKQLARDLKLSHSTILRAVNKLRKQGVPVESKGGHGYRLAEPFQEVLKPPPKKARPSPRRKALVAPALPEVPKATARISKPDQASSPMPQPQLTKPRLSAYPRVALGLLQQGWQFLNRKWVPMARQPGPAKRPADPPRQQARKKVNKNLLLQGSLLLLLAVLVIPAGAVNMGADPQGGVMNPFKGGAGQEAPAEQSTSPAAKPAQEPRVAPEIANIQRDPAPSPPPAVPSSQGDTSSKEAAAPAQTESKAQTKPQPDDMAKALRERDEYKDRVGKLEKEVAKLGSLLLTKKQDGQTDGEGQHTKHKARKSKKDRAKELAAAKVEAPPVPQVQAPKNDVRTVNVRSVVQAEGQWTARLELERPNGQTSQRVVRVGDVVAGMSVHDITWSTVVLTGDSGRQTVLRID